MASHGEMLTAARRTKLGENANWGALVANRRRGLEHWARNNLANRLGHQFIEALSGGSEFGREALAAEERG
jgi:hypothetical protein